MYCLQAGCEHTLYIPTMLFSSCPETRRWFKLKVISYLRECSICEHTYWRELLNDSALYSISGLKSLNLKIKAFRYCEWEKRDICHLCLFAFFSRGKGCPDIVMACETYFCLSDLLAWLSPIPAWSMDLMSCLILRSCLCWRAVRTLYVDERKRGRIL